MYLKKFFGLLVCGLFLSAPLSASSVRELGDVDKYFKHYYKPNKYYHQKNLGNEIVYQIFVDRFANGNRNNDCMDQGRNCAKNKSRNLDRWYAYQGGDLRGLIRAMPYLKQLGVTRIWLTPIFENAHVHAPATRGNGIVTSYHGYWIKDWFRLNEYFTDRGTQDYAIVNEMIKAGAPEIRFYLDTVANHTSPADASLESLDHLNKKNPLDIGVRYPHRGTMFYNGKFFSSFDLELKKHQENNSYTPMFHIWNRAITNWDNIWEVEKYQLARLADLNQNNQYVTEYLDRAHHFWMSKFPGLAGFRIDTIKHVNQGYWRYFSKQMYDKYPRMESFGEYWDAGPINKLSHPYYNETKFSMLDFNFRQVLESVFKNNGSMKLLTKFWQLDPRLGDARSMMTFIDNHDLPRLRAAGMPYQRMKQAVAVWMMSRGVPIIYYGLEQDLFNKGATGDPFNRPMMRFDRDPRMLDFMKKLIRLRRNNQALRYGVTHVTHETDHIIAFERIYKGQVALIVTSTNRPAGQYDQVYVKNLKLKDGNYRDILSGKSYTIRGGVLPVKLRNGDIVVLTNKY